MAVDVNPALMAKLPLEFKKLGLSMHDDFDNLSKDIKGGLNQTDTIKRLGEITNKCIACHSTYRLQENVAKK
jgi:cytochrome c556